ncbi:MAG: hypothetical protein N3F08_04310, partial [Crenarchaeota archaeon]|nr:hypothetical protein [Thermoproteota archaeon]
SRGLGDVYKRQGLEASRMSDYYLKLRISSENPWRIRRELKKLGCLWFAWDSVEIMQLKGLKYIPTILNTGCYVSIFPEDYRRTVKFPLSYSEETIRMFDLLRQRVNVKIMKQPGTRVEKALWPKEIIELREVEDEINRLSILSFLSKDNPEDRKIAEIYASYPIGGDEFKNKTLDEKIDALIRIENQKMRDFAEYFSKAREIHKRYSDAKFWFYVGLKE